MPLTPIDIQQKTFGPELRGYNMDEVDDFLDEVVVALKDYDQRLRDAEDRIRALETELSTRGEDESAISRALVAAQKQADNLIVDARADAERIRADAQGEADQLRADRDAERMSLTQDIARMRATVADLKRRVAELARSAEADLDAMDESASAASSALGSGILDEPVAAGPEPSRQSETPDEQPEQPEQSGSEQAQQPDQPQPGEAAVGENLESMQVGAGLHPFGEEGGEGGEETSRPAAVGQHLSATDEGSGHDAGEWEEAGSGGADEGTAGEEPADEDEAGPGEEQPPIRERRPWERGSV